MADKHSNAHIMYGSQQQQMMANMMGGGAMQYPGPMLQSAGGQHMVYPQQMMNQQHIGMNQPMMNQGMPNQQQQQQQQQQQYQQQQQQQHLRQQMRPVYGMMHAGMTSAGYQQVPMQMMMTNQTQPGFNPQQQHQQPQQQTTQQQQQYRPPPPQYNRQMAFNYQVKQAPAPAPVPVRPPHKPAQPAQKDPRQQQLASTQRRLAELGRQGHNKQVDADSMIQAMFGSTDNVKKKTVVDPGPSPPAQQNDDDFADFGDFMSVPAENSSEPVGNGDTVDVGVNSNTVEEPPVVPEKKQDLTSMMLQCSDLSQPAKAKTFQKPLVKEVKPKVIRQTTFQQSEKARRWEGAVTDDLHSLFTVPRPEPPPAPPVDDLLGGENDATTQPLPTDVDNTATTAPVARPTDFSGQPLPSNHATANEGVHSNQQVSAATHGAANGVGESAPGAPGAPAGPAPHIPPLYYNTAAMPPVYLMVLEAVQGECGIDTAKLYPILLRSQLPREGLGYIWSLANKTAPGRLTNEELFMVLAMVALAQHQVPFDSAEVLRTIPQPPVPNLGQNQVAPQSIPQASTIVPGTTLQPGLIATETPLTVPAAHGTIPAPLNTGRVEQDDFADFQQANEGFGEFVSSPKDFDADETPTPVNDKFTFPEPVISAPAGFTSDVPASDLPPPPLNHTPRLEHKVQDLHFEFDPCRGSDSSSMSSYAFDTQSRDSDTTKSDDFDDFHAADSYSSASSIGGAPAVAHDARNDSVIMSSTMLASLPPPAMSGKYAALREFAPPPPPAPLSDDAAVKKTIAEPTEDEFGSFKDAVVLDSRVLDLKALVNNPNLYNKPEAPEATDNNKYDVFRTVETSLDDVIRDDVTSGQWGNGGESGWADFASAPDVAAGAMEQKSEVRESLPSRTQSETPFSPWRGNANHFTPSFIALGDEPPPLDTDDFDHHVGEDEFGHFSSAPPDDETENQQLEGSLNSSNSSSFFKRQKKTHTNVTELSYSGGVMHDEPPELDDDMNFDDDDDDEDFPDEFSSSHYHNGSQHQHQQPSSLNFEPVALHHQTNNAMNMFDTEPPPLSPGNDCPSSTFPPSQSDHSLESLTAKVTSSIFSKEDSNSIASLELPKPTRDMTADSQSVSSAGSLDMRQEKDGVSVQSLEFQSPLDPGDEVEESFGEFREAPVTGPGTGDESSSWLQQPKDAKEFLSGGVLLTDRYSTASSDEQAIERIHALEWNRCLKSSLNLINDANAIFMEISNASVCGEVVHSIKGNQYIDNLIEVYRVTCRISLSISSTAANNQQLSQLLKDIDLGWNNLQGFVANSPVSPVRFDDKTSELQSSILKADDDGAAQEKACGVCLISVDAPAIHKLFYAGRQYHASCANLWLNCVDSTLPTLRLPELL